MLSTTFTAQICAAFERALAYSPPFTGTARPRLPAADRHHVGVHPAHDPRAVPPVPAAEVEIRRDAEEARIILSYKVEQGYPPYPVLHVRSDWLSTVARHDHVVLDGFPVLEVLDRDAHGRPVAIAAAVVAGFFDPTLHGWRAHADAHYARVSWDSDMPTVGIGARIRQR